MFALIAQISSLLQRSIRPQDEVAHNLMESAEARAGLNPIQAQELRRAAQQFLSVVR